MTLRAFARRGGLFLLGLVLSGLGGEIAIRNVSVPPRTQLVRDRGVRVVDGVPFWDEDTSRHRRECAEEHPERTRVLFFGSSITYGSGLSATEAFTVDLERRLNEAHPSPGFCVMNFAQPGYSFDQKLLVARRELARYPGSLVLWEDWCEWHEYAFIGGAAHGVHGYVRRADGYIGIRGVPDGLNRALFTYSRLYQYVAIAFGEREAASSERTLAVRLVRDRLPELPALAARYGARLALFLTPPLNRPFAEQALSPPDWHVVLQDYARREHIPVTLLEQELEHEDYLALRQDPCCHYNARGHRVLAEVFARIVPGLVVEGDEAAPSE